MFKQSHGITDEQLKEHITCPAPFIVECGCHDGRDTVRFLDLFPDCRVVCFEPDPRPLTRHNPPGFHDRVGYDQRVTLYELAVGCAEQYRVLYRSSGTPPNKSVTDWDHSSSLQKPTKHLTSSPWCTFPAEKVMAVPSVPLDSILVEQFSSRPIDLLWVDVQGGQVDLIRGAERSLRTTQLIYMECHKTPMYEGEPTQEELLELLPGFEPLGLFEGYNFLLRNKS